MDPEVAGSSPVGRPFLKVPILTLLDAIILGIVQGLTEFLPVSSSGHLKLVQYFLGLQNLDRYIIFDLVCHLGTLLAILIVFFRSIKQLVSTNKTLFWQVVLGTLPLFPLVLMMKPIKAAYASPSYLGFFFLMTAAILFLGCRFGKIVSTAEREKHSWRDALLVGMWQAIAILPGVSRSGSTISGARLLGWNANDAVTFSFLLAIPAICGGTILECFKDLFSAPKHQFLSYIRFILRLVGFRLPILSHILATHL